MKKALVFILITMLSLSFVGCKNSSEQIENSTSKETTKTEDSKLPDEANKFDKNKEITLVSREDGSGTRGAFIELFGIEVKGDDGTKKDLTSDEAIIASKTDIMMTNISGDTYSIGYISLGSLNNNVKAVDIEGVKATAENIKNDSYIISRPFNIATKSDVSDITKDFINFILSKEGQEVVAKSYISIDENAAVFSGSGVSGKVIVAGSSSVTPIMEKLKEAYELINPNAKIEIQMSDSTSGMTGAIDGICDIGMASRSLKDSEKEKLNSIEIALDGIAVIVNNENPIKNLTKEQVKEIFIGEMTKWSEIE